MKRVEVTVTMWIGADGQLTATHAPATAADTAILAEMRYGGQDAVAIALLGESVNRMASLLVGLVQASDPMRMKLLSSNDEAETGLMAAKLLTVLETSATAGAPLAIQNAIRAIVGADSAASV